jgi:hypothetical protein
VRVLRVQLLLHLRLQLRGESVGIHSGGWAVRIAARLGVGWRRVATRVAAAGVCSGDDE